MPKSRKTKILLLSLKCLVFCSLGFALFVLALFFYYTRDLPRPEKFTEVPFIQSTKIYDKTGDVLLYDIYGEEKREIVPFDKISTNIKNAVLASEDSRFYRHKGIDLRGIARAVLSNLKSSSTDQWVGGSTITQQLIRSVYLTRQKTLERKIREIVLSVEMEKRYSKDQIFDWYLNKIPFGQNTYGVEAASQTYFNKPASGVSIAEAAVLAALIPAPSRYSPYGPNKERLLRRKDSILSRMAQLGFISQKEMLAAKEEPIRFSDNIMPIKAPHFVMYVKQRLEEKYGEEFLKEKGLRVYTTLDWDIQEYAEQTIKEFDGVNAQFDAYNASLVIVDPKTGHILSLVGSKNYFQKSYPEGCDEKSSTGCLFNPYFDVATTGLRQPGSAFKPFVYATALKKGYAPDTVLWDAKTEFNPNCDPDGEQIKDFYGLDCYHPRNYDGNYRGQVSLRSSLAQSLNMPSVKVLYLAGLRESLQTARDMGITTLNNPNQYGLSLVLGGGEVNLLEMTSAYGVFAAEGLRIPPVSILRIEDGNGNILEENKKEAVKMLDTQVARLINDILSDNDARAPMFGNINALYFSGYDVAAKTGTTQYFNDAWTIGYSPSFAVGVWVGNNNNAPTNKKTGIGLAAPIWRKIMEKLLSSRPPEYFTQPEPIQPANPVLSGQPPNSFHSILYYIDKDNPSLIIPPGSGSDPMLYFWEKGVENYLIGSGANINFFDNTADGSGQNNSATESNQEQEQLIDL